MPSRLFASLLALGALLAAGEARAQAPLVAPTPGPSVPGYAPPGVYAPYGGYAPPYAPYAAPPAGYYYAPAPSAPIRHHSPGMMFGGIVLTSVGGLGVVAGGALFAAGAQTTTTFPPCPLGAKCGPIVQEKDPALKAIGIGVMVGSVAMIGAGIPLVVVGARREPDGAEPAQSLVPDVRVGAGRMSATWSF